VPVVAACDPQYREASIGRIPHGPDMTGHVASVWGSAYRARAVDSGLLLAEWIVVGSHLEVVILPCVRGTCR
jgi:hypothetical protein